MKEYSELYTICVSIEIFHEYYNNSFTPIDLIPGEQTRMYIRRNNLILKKISANRWFLLKMNSEVLEYVDRLVFELHALSDELYYVSDEQLEGENFDIKPSVKPGIWKYIEINTENLMEKESVHIRIDLKSKMKYLEFLFIPKYHSETINLRLLEEKRRLENVGPEDHYILDNVLVKRFVSKETILLKEKPDYNFALWEVRDSGERMLTNRIPLPRPDNISLISPKDTITTYFYF